MKNLFKIPLLSSLAVLCLLLVAADHIDAPAVSGTSVDITDFYAFQSPSNNANMVFVTNIQGLMSPNATASATFDESTLLEINIDNDGDAVEDLVIQAVVKDGKVYAFGPTTPTTTGLTSTINEDANQVSADVTPYGQSAIIGTANNMKVFAGPRDDPFFFDLGAYQAVLAGTATGFSDPGADTFAGTNVMSVVIEVPKSTLGSAATINTWVESKSK